MHDDFNFDWKFYISHYPDLRKSKITTENKAIHHWNNFGKKEGRICCAKKIEHPDIVQLKEIIKSLEHKIDKLSEISRERWFYYFEKVIMTDSIILGKLSLNGKAKKFSDLLHSKSLTDFVGLPKDNQQLYDAIIKKKGQKAIAITA